MWQQPKATAACPGTQQSSPTALPKGATQHQVRLCWEQCRSVCVHARKGASVGGCPRSPPNTRPIRVSGCDAAGVRQSRHDGYSALEAAVFGSTQCQKWKPQGSGVPRPRGGYAPDSVLWLHRHGTNEILLLCQSAAYTAPARSLRQSIPRRGGSGLLEDTIPGHPWLSLLPRARAQHRLGRTPAQNPV